jgi:hypothetical protein
LMKVLPWGRGMGEMVHVDSIGGAHSDTMSGYGTCNRSSGWYMIRHVSCHGLVGHFALTSLHLFQSKHEWFTPWADLYRSGTWQFNWYHSSTLYHYTQQSTTLIMILM